jgi:hypothetical protein
MSLCNSVDAVSSACFVLWSNEIPISNQLKRIFIFCVLLSFSLVAIYEDCNLRLLTDNLLPYI